MRDFRYAIRTLLRNPGFSLAAVIRAVLLAPLPEDIDAILCSANLFSVFGIRPVMGREFTADEDKFGAVPWSRCEQSNRYNLPAAVV